MCVCRRACSVCTEQMEEEDRPKGGRGRDKPLGEREERTAPTVCTGGPPPKHGDWPGQKREDTGREVRSFILSCCI